MFPCPIFDTVSTEIRFQPVASSGSSGCWLPIRFWYLVWTCYLTRWNFEYHPIMKSYGQHVFIRPGFEWQMVDLIGEKRRSRVFWLSIFAIIFNLDRVPCHFAFHCCFDILYFCLCLFISPFLLFGFMDIWQKDQVNNYNNPGMTFCTAETMRMTFLSRWVFHTPPVLRLFPSLSMT